MIQPVIKILSTLIFRFINPLKDLKTIREELKEIIQQLIKVPYIPFPVSLHTVDIIAYRNCFLKKEVLLGRKHNSEKWVIIGGFVDPGESSEAAAAREFFEEAKTKIESLDRFKYLGSYFIDDKRYKTSCHKITTSFFFIELTELESLSVLGGDDIAEVKWFEISDVENFIQTNHLGLFKKFLEK